MISDGVAICYAIRNRMELADENVSIADAHSAARTLGVLEMEMVLINKKH